jgi:hypothetical protein
MQRLARRLGRRRVLRAILTGESREVSTPSETFVNLTLAHLRARRPAPAQAT